MLEVAGNGGQTLPDVSRQHSCATSISAAQDGSGMVDLHADEGRMRSALTEQTLHASATSGAILYVRAARCVWNVIPKAARKRCN